MLVDVPILGLITEKRRRKGETRERGKDCGTFRVETSLRPVISLLPRSTLTSTRNSIDGLRKKIIGSAAANLDTAATARENPKISQK
ncbi:uncharacterized protein MYCFIDRAFT_172132 [Pseudocercospora fijiensis CIRAD86]|uniref:Uncharacterized protein n=1 Tax=Pseudocercospora fijiensis (strain CIRAD86) TaxID=383855 RepID=M3BAV8_PSEFD|nr:uncharacterized protein MYCFIDRAFT_172132 [Pseudocercospora fijiensis CIRAD86]EME86363.1 hypothetical protein MYCFIDRAFT_172132 [Pseudocercospora fijiensis CIRAD86]